MREEAITSIAVIAGVMEKDVARRTAPKPKSPVSPDWSATERATERLFCRNRGVRDADLPFQDFVQYYDSIMPMLKQFVMTATSKKEQILTCKASSRAKKHQQKEIPWAKRT